MATKAERFRAAAERKGLRQPRRKTPRGPGMRRRSIDTRLPGVSGDDRRWGGASTGARNRTEHAEHKATYAYEDSNADVARPSRKSTRASSRHLIKPDNPLKSKVLLRATSPTARSGQRPRVKSRRPMAPRAGAALRWR